MRKLYFGGIAILIIFISACSSKRINYGNIISQEIEVSRFTSIKYDGFGEVYLTQGDKPSVSVSTYKKFQKYADIYVKDKHLYISIDKDISTIDKDLQPIKVYVTIEKFRIMDLKGNSSVIINNLKQHEVFINTKDNSKVSINESNIENLNVLNNSKKDVTGKNLSLKNLMAEVDNIGNIKIDNLNSNFVKTELIGRGDIILSGKTNNLDVLIMNFGELYSEDLISNNVDTVINGRGSAFVNAKYGIVVKLLGSGNLFYKGEPKAIIFKGEPSQVVKLFEKNNSETDKTEIKSQGETSNPEANDKEDTSNKN